MTQESTQGNITLQVSHLKKSFRHGRKRVLEDVSLSAEGGECIGILGANGCGKSTLLSILAGLQKADAGFFRLDGVSQTTQTGKGTAPSIGYVPQDCPLIPELNAMDNLKLWYCNSPLSLEKELTDGFLAMLGIPDFLKTPVRKMSGGMKKRLSIGCALADSPKLLLLDEPGSALDLIGKEHIETYLKSYKDMGNIIFLTTHEEREIAFCDRLYLLKGGIVEPLKYDGNIHTLAALL